MYKFDDIKNMVYKMAHQFSTNANEFEEYCEIGFITVLEKADSFDPDKGVKFSSFIFSCLKNKMIDEKRREKITGKIFSYNNEVTVIDEDHSIEKFNRFENTPSYQIPADKRLIFKETITGLSEESQMVINLILQNPSLIIQQARSLAPKYLKGALIRFLRDRNMSHKAIHYCIDEIQMALREV